MSQRGKDVATASGDAVSSLTAAMREARIEAAERTGVVVDLHGAQLARLEILNDALDPLFAALPAGVDIFDRGISQGEPPRLWIDMLAHVVLAPDRRAYRFVVDARYGRKVLAESAQLEPIVKAITQYVAHRLIERERAVASGLSEPRDEGKGRSSAREARPQAWRGLFLFALGVIAGASAVLATAWFLAPRLY